MSATAIRRLLGVFLLRVHDKSYCCNSGITLVGFDTLESGAKEH
jgi:hypothetical protein